MPCARSHESLYPAGAAAVLAIAAACGTVPAESTDGGPDAAAEPDAAPRGCDRNDPFGAPERIDALSLRPYQCCAVFADPDTIYFAAGAAGDHAGTDLYRARRTSSGFVADSGAIKPPSTDDGWEWAPAISADGDTLYYNHYTPPPMGQTATLEIYRARATAKGRFAVGSLVVLGGTTGTDADPAITSAGMVFNRGGDLYAANFDGDGFAAPVRLGASTTMTDHHPAVSADL